MPHQTKRRYFSVSLFRTMGSAGIFGQMRNDPKIGMVTRFGN